MRAVPAVVILLLGTPAMAAPATESVTLENGLRVEVRVDPATPFAEVGLIYRTGSKDDPIGRAGLAHLVEHLMFQGTRHLRPGDVHRLFLSAGAPEVKGSTSADK